MAAHLDGDAFRRVLGDELRAARKERGLIRKDVAPHLDHDMSLQTLATYELGTRNMPVVRFVEICRELGVSPVEILRRAYERVFPETAVTWTVDLTDAARLEDPELAPLCNWAASRLRFLPLGARRTVRLDRAAVEPLAALCGLEPCELIRRLPPAPLSNARSNGH
jgi:transcriptional regulator with XRE-family HTH domain